MLKKIPVTSLITALLNLIQVIVVIGIMFTMKNIPVALYWIMCFEIVFVLVATYFLLRNKWLAWILLLFWFILNTVSFESSFFSWNISFGFHTNYHVIMPVKMLSGKLIHIKLGMDFIAAAMLVIHLFSEKKIKAYAKAKKTADEMTIKS